MRYLTTTYFFLSGLQLFRVEVLFNERKHFVLRRNSDFQALHRKVRTQNVWSHRFYGWKLLSTASNLWLCHTTRWRRLDKQEREMVNREFTWTLRCCSCCRTFKPTWCECISACSVHQSGFDLFCDHQLRKIIQTPDFPSKRSPHLRTKPLEQRRQELEDYMQVRWHGNRSHL